MSRKESAPFSLFRPSVAHRAAQYAFLFFYIYVGARFFAYAMWAMGETETFTSRPPSVEAFLPIGALVGLKRLLLTGSYDPIHPAGLTILLMALVTAFLFRKGFCGYLCPVGAISGVLERLGKRLGISRPLPRIVSVLLTVPKYLLLAFFVKIVLLDMPVAALEGFIRTPYYRVADTKMLLFFMPPSLTVVLILAATLLGSLLIPGFWCRGFCPYGALLGLVSMFSPTAIRRDKETCINCRRCSGVCPSRIEVHAKERVSGPECVGCTECVGACPVPGCLGTGLGWGKRFARLPRLFLPLGMVCAVLLFYFWAEAAGHWRNNIPPEMIRRDHQSIREMGHP